MPRNSYLVLFLVLVLGVLLLAGACAPQQKPLQDADPSPQRNDITRNDNLPRNNEMIPGRLTDVQARAERIAEACDQVPGVEDATVVISGDTCYVGLDVEGNLDEGETESVERACLNRALATDPTVDRCVVASDADTVSRLRNIYQGLRRGTPISTFGNELEEITRRIQPRVREE